MSLLCYETQHNQKLYTPSDRVAIGIRFTISEAMTRSMQCPSIMISIGIVIVDSPSSQGHRGIAILYGAPYQWKLAEGGLSLLVYIIESVCLFAVNAKNTARIDAKRSGITKNDSESVLCVLKSPVLVFLGRYRAISGFSFAADRHFTYLSSTFGSCVDAFVKRRRPFATSLLFHR